jgi:NYN domain
VAGIGGTDDAVDFDLVAARHRDFGRCGDVAAIAHLLGEAAIDAHRDERQAAEWSSVSAVFFSRFEMPRPKPPGHLFDLVRMKVFARFELVAQSAHDEEFVDQTGRRKVKGNMDIELAVDAMEIAGSIDHMVLFSGDGDFRSLVEAVQRRGVRVTVVSTISTQPPMVEPLSSCQPGQVCGHVVIVCRPSPRWQTSTRASKRTRAGIVLSVPPCYADLGQGLPHGLTRWRGAVVS